MKFIGRLLAPLLFFLLAASSLTICIYKPIHNWDMIGYIAAAKSFELRNVELLQKFTYEQLRNAVSNAEYDNMAQEKGSGYLHSVSTDPSAFQEQLPFYQNRPVYTGLIYLLYKTGVSIASATYLISGFAIAAAIAILFLLSALFLAKPFSYSFPLIMTIFGVLDLARYSTPDGLAFLTIMASVYLFLNRRIALLLVLLPMMIGIRTDLILYTTPLLLFIFLFDKKNRWKVTLSTIASFILYFGIWAYWGRLSWSTVFYFALVQHLAHPITMPPTLTTQEYFGALLNGLKNLVIDKSFVLYVLVAAYSLYFIESRVKKASAVNEFKTPSTVLAIVSMFFIGSHFILFPFASDRYFSAFYIIGAFSLLVMITNYIRGEDFTHG
jgi:hypothetical protein